MMDSLLAIGDASLALQFFEQVLPLEYATLEGNTLHALAELATWKVIEKPLVSLFRDQQPDKYRSDLSGLLATFGALASLGDPVSGKRKQVCKSLLQEVDAMLARWERTPLRAYHYSAKAHAFAGVVEPLVQGICSVGTQGDVKHLLTQIAAHPEHYDLHTVLIPAVRNLHGDRRFMESGKLAQAAERELRQYCIERLKQRTNKKPQPPSNWKRSVKFKCDCADCRELAEFLNDKVAKVHRFPRREDLRRHLHQQIDHHRVDCSHVTERVGRPYTLVCTKNQASFQRELKQYETDCELLSDLSGG